MVCKVAAYTVTLADLGTADHAVTTGHTFLSVQSGPLPGTVVLNFLVTAVPAPSANYRYTVHKTGTEFPLGAKSFLGSVRDLHVFQEPL